MTEEKGEPLTENKMNPAKELFKKWCFVPNFHGQITVTDLFNGQRRERQLRPTDFQFEEDGSVPNYGMLTYVGVSEICKHITELQARVERYEKALRGKCDPGLGGKPRIGC